MKDTILNVTDKYGNIITGALFFSCIILLGYYTIIGKNIKSQGTFILPIQLTTSEGLQTGAKVFIQGVEAGSVGNTYFMELDHKGWPKDFSNMDKSYGQTVIAILHLHRIVPVFENYTIKTKHSTILAPKIVEITPGHAIINTNTNNKNFDHKKKFKKIRPLSLEPEELYLLQKEGILFNKKDTHLLVARNYDDPLFQIATVMNENKNDVHAITTDLREITHKLDQGNGSVAKVVNQPQLLAGVNSLLKEIILLTNEAGKGSEDIRETQSIISFLELLLAFSGAL